MGWGSQVLVFVFLAFLFYVAASGNGELTTYLRLIT